MSQDKEAPISEHLAELIYRLRVVLISIFVSSIVMAFIPADISVLTGGELLDFNNPTSGFQKLMNSTIVSMVIRIIQSETLPEGAKLIAYSWVDPLSIYFIVSFILGIIVSLPVIGYETYKYVNPALYPHERRFAIAFVSSFMILFTFGAFYAYKLLLPVTIKILYYFTIVSGAEPYFSIKDFFYFVALVIISSGLFFTLPIIITLAMKYDVVSVERLIELRKYVILGILIFAAVITPDPTPVSMLLISVPFIFLFELAIRIGGWLKSREGRQELKATP